jgi:hypothetical protein
MPKAVAMHCRHVVPPVPLSQAALQTPPQEPADQKFMLGKADRYFSI